MPDIKKKSKSALVLKKLDKSVIYTQKLKSNLVQIKERTNSLRTRRNDEINEVDYGADQIQEKTKILADKSVNALNRYGKKATIKTKKNIENAGGNIKKRINNYAVKKRARNIAKTKKELAKTSKRVKRTIKNTPRTIKKTAKMTKKTVKLTVKMAKRAYQIAKLTAKVTIMTVKAAIKVTIATIKAIIAATEALVSAIVAGGWVAVLIIVIICLIALLCSSIYGIFFSNDESANPVTMSSVVSQINTEFTNKITTIQNTTEHDDYEIKSKRAEWKDVISVYAVLVANGEEQSDVITLDDEKIEKLKKLFWEMNTISSRTEEIEKEIETTDEKGNTKTEKQKRTVLYIEITSLSVDDMMLRYNFNQKQREQIAELQKQEYNSLWSNVLYGASGGSSDIVQVAFTQIGNVGGEPYWSWYGFNSRVSWCACFVSYCANECGYIDAGIIPKFAACEAEGVTWFKTCGLWQDGGYIPKARRYYIFRLER